MVGTIIMVYRSHSDHPAGANMDSGDVLNYSMAITVIASKAWKPVLAAMFAWGAMRVFKRAKTKKQLVKEKISQTASNAKAAIVNNIPTAASVASAGTPAIANVVTAARNVAQKGIEGGAAAVSSVAPVVQQAAVATVNAAAMGATKAGPAVGEVAGRAAVGAKAVAQMAIAKAPEAGAAAGKFVGLLKSSFAEGYRKGTTANAANVVAQSPTSDREK